MAGSQRSLFDFIEGSSNDKKNIKEDSDKGAEKPQGSQQTSNSGGAVRSVSFTNRGPQKRRRTVNRRAEEGKVYYLLDVIYDGKKGKAICRLYDKDKEEIVIYEDATQHKPYFLTDLEPDKLRGISPIVKDESFDHLEVVTKIDPYTRRPIKLTKVVVKDPLAVARMRDKIPKAYEAHIKYFNNYIYDLGLVPGLPHVIENNRIRVFTREITEEESRTVTEAFKDEPEDAIKMALAWYPMLEAEVPEVKRAAIDIEVFTIFKGRVPDTNKAEWPVISIALASTEGIRRVYLLKRGEEEPEKEQNVELMVFSSERELFQTFFEDIKDYPIVLTFNGDDFDMPYLINRALKLDIPLEEIPLVETERGVSLQSGLHIDLYRFFFNKAVKNYAFEGKYSEYGLDAIANALIGVSKVKIDDTVSNLTLTKLVEYNMRDSDITLRLTTENGSITWKLIILFARISKAGIEELTRTEISSWVKNQYYWEHRQRNWLIPLKEEIANLTSTKKTRAVIKGKGYKGAVVIDPPQGVFFNVTVLDFASLYPSIIKNWNLSYETVDLETCEKEKEIADETGAVLHRVCLDRPGITAVMTGLLRDFRVKIYKKKAKVSPKEQRELYDVVQRAMKVFINATYGVFGAETFPLYAPAVAESVTALGRYVITTTSREAMNQGLKVLYGDTDSLFIHDPPKDKLDYLIKWVKEEFNLDFEVDKVYKYVAFSKRKKNYFGVHRDGKVEVKGMLAKKRNTPEFLKKVFSQVKDDLARINSPEELDQAKRVIGERIKGIYYGVKNREFNLDELSFRVMLAKDVESYTKNTPQHVKAARFLKEYDIQVLPRDIIMFVKVKGRDGVKPVQLAKLPEIDSEKYMEAIRSTFEQLLAAFNINWDEIESVSRIESFFK